MSCVSDHGAERNRVEKLLEDEQLKLSVAASDIFGMSGRDMMAALIAGEHDPKPWHSWPGPACGSRSRNWRRFSWASSPTTTANR
jgi:hypothetical protein